MEITTQDKFLAVLLLIIFLSIGIVIGCNIEKHQGKIGSLEAYGFTSFDFNHCKWFRISGRDLKIEGELKDGAPAMMYVRDGTVNVRNAMIEKTTMPRDTNHLSMVISHLENQLQNRKEE